MLSAVDDFFDAFSPDYFSDHSQGSKSTNLESDQAENSSPETAARPLEQLEEPVRHDSEMPAPVSGEDHSAEPEIEESFDYCFDGSVSGDDDSLFGDGDVSEDTGVSAENKAEEPVRLDSGMPTPVSGEDKIAEPETEESSNSLFDGEIGDENSMFGDGDASSDSSLSREKDAGENSSLFVDGRVSEDTGASAQENPEESVRHNSTMPSPAWIEIDEELLEEEFQRAFEEDNDMDNAGLSGERDAGEDTGAHSQDESEGISRHDPATSPPAPVEDDSVDDLSAEEMEGLLADHFFGETNEDTEAHSQGKPKKLARHDAAIPSPAPVGSNPADDLSAEEMEGLLENHFFGETSDSEDDEKDSLFGDSSEDISSGPAALSAVGDYRPTSPAPPSRQLQSQEKSFVPSRRPLDLPLQPPQPEVEQRSKEDPADRFPGLALPRGKPAAPPVASSTATPSAQPDANPVASVDAQSRKRARDDSPIEIEDSSPEPQAKRARKDKEKACTCRNCKAGRRCCRAGPEPCTKEEVEARNGAARIQLGLGSHKYSFFGSNATQDRYGKPPPSKTKRAKARREALEQLIHSIPTAETELPLDLATLANNLDNAMLWSADGSLVQLPEDAVDTAISANSNKTTVDLRGVPSTSALRVSSPASLLEGGSNSGASPASSRTTIDLTDESSSAHGSSPTASLSTGRSTSGTSSTSSRTTIDLTGETGPAQETSSPASFGPGRSNNGAATTPSGTTIDLTREPEAESARATNAEQLAQQMRTEEPAPSPDPNLPAPTNGGSSVHDELLRQQEEALKVHNATLSAELKGHQARGHMTDVSIDFSGSEGVFRGKRQMKRNNDMRNHREKQR
ncbi:hypothetical protein AC579_6625 [Pseudocercospora musae]|uniref:Uncharacterized protein n=1 Tax=Pseudocercospora musae TaxID=113226 RepID=A0A139I7F5_9PEZI|nr:hypothetical protein AC579_6625 [Pseudocercospora musae]